jgi:hypothetical protein
MPTILDFKSSSNPFITDKTTFSAITPMATPSTEIQVSTDMADRLRLERK